MQFFTQFLSAKQKASETLNLIGLIMILYFTGQLIAQQLTGWLFGFKGEQLANMLLHPEQAFLNRNMFIFLQTCSALLSCLILPAAYQYFFQKRTITSYFSPHKKILPFALLLTALVVVVSMPFNTIFIEWNKRLQFPDFLAGLEKQLQQLEQQAAQLTTLFTTITSGWQLLVGFLFIAIIPAIVEEFFFRGFIQTRFAYLYKNTHLAIFCTGFLFSLFHFQFYGFLPRMLQGILFGYLFHWSKNLWYPVIAHLVNNGFTLLLYYFLEQKKLQVPISVSMACFFLSAFLIFLLKRYFSRHLVLA